MANRFAKGLARIREPVWNGTDCGGASAFGTVGLGVGGIGAEAGLVDGAVGTEAPTEVSSTKSLKAAISDSFSTIIHTSWKNT